VPRQRPTAAQMIDFRIADPRANSRFASRRFPVIYGSTTRPPGVKFFNDFLARVRVPVCVGSWSCLGKGARAFFRGTPAFAFSNIHEVGSLPRQRPTAAQMIDFRIADPGANSRFASSLSRHLRINYSSLQASNSPMISRAWACAYMLGVGRAGGRICVGSGSGWRP